MPIKSKSKIKDNFEIKIPKDKVTLRIFNIEINYSVGANIERYLDKKMTKTINCRIKMAQNEYIDPVNATEGFNQETKDILINTENPTFIIFLLPDKYTKGELIVQILDSNTNIVLKETKKIPYEIYI